MGQPRARTPVATPSRTQWHRSELPLLLRRLFPPPMTAAAPASPESFPFLGCHLLPTLCHASLPSPRGRASGTAEAPEQDLAQDQQSERLPESNGANASDLRQEVVPQLHHDEAEQGGNDQPDGYKSQGSCKSIHVLTPSERSRDSLPPGSTRQIRVIFLLS